MDSTRVLESWKEIAAHLRRNVRTCQLWERELGLPVHRIDGSPKARVFAYRDELDRWLEAKLHSHGHTHFHQGGSRRARTFAILAAAVLFLALSAVAVRWLVVPRPAPAVPSTAPAVIVLKFENLSGDRSMDIWRVALPALVLADLSQSRQVRTVPAEQILTALRELDLAGAEMFSAEDVRRIAVQTRVTYVLTGSFIKAGESVLVAAILQTPGTGESSEMKTEVRGEDRIIRAAEDLARQILAALGLLPDGTADDEGNPSGP